MKSVLTAPQGRLLRTLTRLIEASLGNENRNFPPVIVESFETDDWASLTFAGQRHRIALVVDGASLDSLPPLERLDIAGAIVAEAQIVSANAVANGVALKIAVMTVGDET